MINVKKYVSNYPELKNVRNPKKHFIQSGLLENRTDNDLSFHTFSPKSKKFVLFTNARDESNLKEWCAHHLLLGFDCIYIFDHLSKKPIIEELHTFDSRICVFRINVNHPLIKHKCIHYATTIAKYIKCEWMLYLDADEYLYLNKPLKEFIYGYPSDASLISINWLLFGSNNFIEQPQDKKLIDHFTKSEKILNQHVKSFVKPEKIISFSTPHAYKVHGKAYDSQMKIKIHSDSPFVQMDEDYQHVHAFIAHYIYQSEEMYFIRKLNRRSDIGSIYEKCDIHAFYNDIDNYVLKEKYSEQIETYLKEKVL